MSDPTRPEMDAALAELRAAYPAEGWRYFDPGAPWLMVRDDLSACAEPAPERLASDTLRWLAATGGGNEVERLGRTAIGAVEAMRRATRD